MSSRSWFILMGVFQASKMSLFSRKIEGLNWAQMLTSFVLVGEINMQLLLLTGTYQIVRGELISTRSSNRFHWMFSALFFASNSHNSFLCILRWTPQKKHLTLFNQVALLGVSCVSLNGKRKKPQFTLFKIKMLGRCELRWSSCKIFWPNSLHVQWFEASTTTPTVKENKAAVRFNN